MKICIVAAPWDFGRGRTYATFPPLGIGYLASTLEATGYSEVTLVDPDAEGWTVEDMYDYFDRSAFDVIGISAVTITYPNARSIALVARGKCKGATIVMGGPHVTVRPVESLLENPAVDFIVIGEGEHTLRDLVVALDSGRDVRGIQGLAYRRDGEVVFSPSRPPIADLDSVPFPARHLLPMQKYSGNVRGRPEGAIITSRGCPGKCVYCAGQLFGRNFRHRSARNVVDEIQVLVTRYGIQDVAIQDDAFTADRARAIEICDEILRRDLGIRWSAVARANHADPDLLRRMREAGCWSIEFGIESGSDRILKVIKKGLSVRRLREAFRMAQDVGLEVTGNIMLGLPGDTRETVQATWDLANDLNLHQLGLSILVPYPGTEIHDRLKREGRLFSEDWSKYAKVAKEGESTDLVMKYDNFSHAELQALKREIRRDFDLRRRRRAIEHLWATYAASPRRVFDKIRAMGSAGMLDQMRRVGAILWSGLCAISRSGGRSST